MRFYWRPSKRRYMLIVKMQDGWKRRNRVFRYNTDSIEIMLDAYWMLNFGHAESVSIRSTKNRKKILAVLKSTTEWQQLWEKKYGKNANWFVFSDRIVGWN